MKAVAASAVTGRLTHTHTLTTVITPAAHARRGLTSYIHVYMYIALIALHCSINTKLHVYTTRVFLHRGQQGVFPPPPPPPNQKIVYYELTTFIFFGDQSQSMVL